ncbi:unnamed protein product [Nyctereutes procyonoides]|uniref:(raccoon dog) hypothetical protein n=1 Tax=Nyctereutes procyonoides TaxID=34880 RepID=A0A811XW15_NYCPR|nr:unnamed protein product [Nyctereutes procyonoides]
MNEREKLGGARAGSVPGVNVGVAHSEGNPSTQVMNSQGIWLAYTILVGLLHVVLLSIPFFSIPVVWTLTNIIHNLRKGLPLTHWEQMDYGLQFIFSHKSLSISPNYDAAHFLTNTASWLSILPPKLPQFQRDHIFGINKY